MQQNRKRLPRTNFNAQLRSIASQNRGAKRSSSSSEPLPSPPRSMTHRVNHHRLLFFEHSEINDVWLNRKRPNRAPDSFALMFDDISVGDRFQRLNRLKYPTNHFGRVIAGVFADVVVQRLKIRGSLRRKYNAVSRQHRFNPLRIYFASLPQTV